MSESGEKSGDSVLSAEKETNGHNGASVDGSSAPQIAKNGDCIAFGAAKTANGHICNGGVTVGPSKGLTMGLKGTAAVPMLLPKTEIQRNDSQGNQKDTAKTLMAHPMALPKADSLKGPPFRVGGNAPSSKTPTIFKQEELRSGKWIAEEEAYAEMLITLFEKGRVSDCENGMTLRSYLSQKLHCAPMRISKKFAGKGIGKMVYLSKLSSLPPVSFEETFKLETKLKALENAFYKAVFPDGPMPPLPPGFPILSGPAVAAVPMVPGLVPLIQGPHPFQVPGIAPAPSVQIPIQSAIRPPVVPVPSQTPSPASATVIAPALANGQMLANPAGQAVQVQLSFLTALQDPRTSQAIAATLAKLPTQVVPSQPQRPTRTTLAPAPPTTNGNNHVGPKRPAINAAMPPPMSITSRGMESTVPGDSSTSEIPDFLAGFDKVTKDSNQNSTTLLQEETTLNSEYSPPFTSKSFDDFHRFLGKDVDEIAKPVPACALTCQPATTSTASIHPRPAPQREMKDVDSHLPDTMALFSAESYAMFAQESALAMSHHPAYSATNSIAPPPFGPSASTAPANSQSDNVTTMETPEDSSVYGQIVGNPLTQIAPSVDHLNQKVEPNVVSGSDRASSSDPMSNNDTESSAESRPGSSEDNSNDSNDSEGSSCDGANEEDGPMRKKLRLKSRVDETNGDALSI